MALIQDFAFQIVDTTLEFTGDMYYGSKRTLETFGIFGKNVKQENNQELFRIVDLVYSIKENKDIIGKMALIISTFLLDNIPEEYYDDILKKISLKASGHLTRRLIKDQLKTIIRKRLEAKILERFESIIARKVAKSAVTATAAPLVGTAITVTALQGKIERASDASKRLQKLAPSLHSMLKRESLDMLYFLVEEQLAKLIYITIAKARDPKSYQEFSNILKYDLNRIP